MAKKRLIPKLQLMPSKLNLGKMSVLSTEEPKLPLRIISTANLKYAMDQLINDIAITGEWSSLVNGSVFYVSTVSKWKNISFHLIQFKVIKFFQYYLIQCNLT